MKPAVKGFPYVGLVEIGSGVSSVSLCWVMFYSFMYEYFLLFVIENTLEVKDAYVIRNAGRRRLGENC